MFNEPIATSLREILFEIADHYHWKIHALEIMPDHVHIFVQGDHITAPVTIAKTLKSISTVRLFRMYPQLKQRRFWGSGLWSRGTFYSTVGHAAENVVQKYIETQKQRNSSHGTRPRVSLRRT